MKTNRGPSARAAAERTADGRATRVATTEYVHTADLNSYGFSLSGRILTDRHHWQIHEATPGAASPPGNPRGQRQAHGRSFIDQFSRSIQRFSTNVPSFSNRTSTRALSARSIFAARKYPPKSSPSNAQTLSPARHSAPLRRSAARRSAAPAPRAAPAGAPAESAPKLAGGADSRRPWRVP